jgi:hypothetical protein
MDLEHYVTIGVMHNSRGPFTYRLPPDLASSVEEGSFVAVYNAYGYSVGEVVEVHAERQDTNPDISYRWAFQLIDTGRAGSLDPDAIS